MHRRNTGLRGFGRYQGHSATLERKPPQAVPELLAGSSMTVTSFGQIGVEPTQVPRLERTGSARRESGFESELEPRDARPQTTRSAEERRDQRRTEGERLGRREQPAEPRPDAAARTTARDDEASDGVPTPANQPTPNQSVANSSTGPDRADTLPADPGAQRAIDGGSRNKNAGPAPDPFAALNLATHPGTESVGTQTAANAAQSVSPLEAKAAPTRAEAPAPTSPLQRMAATPRRAAPTAPVHQPRFVTRPEAFDAESIVRRLAVETSRGNGRIEIELDPPELGRIDVDMFIEDGRARLVVAVDRPDVADAIERRLDELTRSLAEQGITVDGAEVRQREQKAEDRTPTHSSGSGNDAAEGHLAGNERRILHRHDGSGLDVLV